jgi:hypothetical protein
VIHLQPLPTTARCRRRAAPAGRRTSRSAAVPPRRRSRVGAAARADHPRAQPPHQLRPPAPRCRRRSAARAPHHPSSASPARPCAETRRG